MTLEELSEWSGERPEDLREWRALGLVGVGGGGDEFAPDDVERARVVGLLLRRGISLEAIAKTYREQNILASYLHSNFTPRSARAYSLDEAASSLGLDVAAVRRLWRAIGFHRQMERLDEEDLQALKTLKVAVDAGFPEEALLQLARVYTDALGRVADAETRLFHFYVHERLKAGGLSGRALVEATDASGDRMRPLVEPILLYFHRRGLEQAAREDIVLHLQEDAGLELAADVPAQLRVTVLFVDLSSFTPLTEAMGDAAAAGVLARFSDVVREAVSRCEGRVVKQIGDGRYRQIARQALAVWLLSSAAAAVDLTGKWRFESTDGGPSQLVQITQTGNALSFTYYGFAFSGTVTSGAPFSTYSATATSPYTAGIGGRVTPSGNLLDGRLGAEIPPGPPIFGAAAAQRCTCDDGNTVPGDGCAAACPVE